MCKAAYPVYRFQIRNLITVFKTVQFWPEFDANLNEVKKKLKPSGKFLIVNRLPQKDSKWYEFSQIKNAKEYNEKLRIAGFSKISLDVQSKRGWIVIVAQ